MAKKIPAPKKMPDRKTDALSIRIDPRLRFGLELLARKQRRSVTGVVEWSIDQALGTEAAEYRSNGEPVTFTEVVKAIWNPNEVERLAGLATTFPDLMTYDETRMWAVIQSTMGLWLPSKSRTLDANIVVNQWEKLRPLLVAASEKSVVRGLTDEELEAGGIEGVGEIPF